ncbi:MAG: glycosyltransferase, WbnK-like family [Deltaproteobacteria bacterium]|nr:glycosyltransferase, WbnK-like family [Deltaproteobacteria bacterium]
MKETGTGSLPVGVAYVLPGLGRGGTEKHVLDLASRIDRSRFSPCVISTAEDSAMEGDFAGRGIPVYRLPYRGVSIHPARFLPLLRDARRFFREFARILAERRISVLHAYLPAANVLGMAAALGRGTRVRIVSKRALCRYKEGHPVYSRFEELANLAADAVMVNSRAVAEEVRRSERFTGGKMFLVYNGLDIPPEREGRKPPPADLGLPPDAPLVSYVANLREDKGHLCLVEAAQAVAAVFPAVRFLFVGREDREAASIRDRIRILGLERHILLTGSRRDVAEILDASDLVAHPGEQEGLSNAILEAMAAGLPVVASSVGGNPEAVEDGETGRLVPPGDAPAMASAILELLRDPARAAAMGRAGRERARRRFSLEGMVSEVERMYLELLRGEHPSPGRA